MKYLLTILAAAAFFASCSSSKKTTASAEVQLHTFNLSSSSQNKIMIDGDLSEWDASLAYKDPASTVTSIITSDSSNIYIALRIDQPWLQMKLLQMGMQIYFDTTNNKSMRHFITYPIMPQNVDENFSAKNNPGEKKILMQHAIILQTNGMAETSDGMHEAFNANGIKAAMKTDVTNNLTYELAVPIKEIYGTGYSPHLNAISFLNIGFVINAMPKESNSSDNSGSSQMQTGGSRMHGGQSGGGYHQGQFNNSQTSYNATYTTKDLNNPTNFWVKAAW